MENKNCHTCAFRKSIPGDCHSQCGHPLMNKAQSVPGVLVSILTGRIDLSKLFDMQVNPHGFKNGWANFPINYDPTWLIGECKAYMTPIEHEEFLKINPDVKEFEQACLNKAIFK